MDILTLVWGFCVGIFLPVQAGANGRLIRHLGHPVYASLWSFATAAVIMAFFSVLVRYMGMFGSSQVRAAAGVATPWWAWLGGAMGAFYVTSAASLAPKVGALMLTLVLLAGQLIASLGLDQFGMAGFPQRNLSPMRIGGVIVVVAGVMMVFKGTTGYWPWASRR